ncbi:hypothetical protein [Halochromatium glycolicum]|uniref:Uncharacterized protein n=1 Tax=Halochromatium glycolicum TaxID=85075 RepID=A0AAJ0U4I0_9GAMM|nr:hypothetical protein [Halochromatium glycolicum]MBK1705119.1 hypothetical protein [Halochromatium glycolicum]
MDTTDPTDPTDDIAARVARLSAELVDRMQERELLRRAHRPREAVLRDARALVDDAAARYRRRLADKLQAFGAPHAPALRLFAGPDADALCFLLGDQIKQALGKNARDWPSTPVDRERRLEELDKTIPELEDELARIRNLFIDGTPT